MKKPIVVWSVVVVLSFLLAPIHAQVAAPENPLLQMLRFVSDNENNRKWLTYGDLATWHTSWNIPRVDSFNQLDTLTPDQRAHWLYIAGTQTDVPNALGLNYIQSDNMRGYYGFDVFDVDRYMEAGSPPDLITIVDFSFDKTQIADALTASGYTTQTLDSGERIYQLNDDYGLDIKAQMHVGKLGELNRIALLDGQMLIGRATAPVTTALSAFHGDTPSLADDLSYIAAVKALDDPALENTGELVGAIIVDHAELDDQAAFLSSLSSNEATRILDAYQAAPLPAYNLVLFATRHGNGATHLILDVVFPTGTDAKTAANVLADRMKNYTSLVSRQPLSDRWSLELAAGTKIGGLPTALVVMKVDDPPPTPEGQAVPNARVLSWLQMVSARDTAYLISQP